MARGEPALNYEPVRDYVGKLPGYPCDKCTNPRKNNPAGCTTDCPVWAEWFRKTWRKIQNKFNDSTNKE